MTKTLLRPGLRARIGRVVLCVAVVVAFMFPPTASAIILMDVIGPLILFEIEGVGFDFYATSNGTRFRVRDTDTDLSGIVNVQGQTEWRSGLSLMAVSRGDRDQRIRIEIDIAPLRGRTSGRFFELDARGVAVGPDPVTEPLLAALEGPLRLGFVLEWRSGHPGGPLRLAVYRLHSVWRQERADTLAGTFEALSGRPKEAVRCRDVEPQMEEPEGTGVTLKLPTMCPTPSGVACV